MSARHCGRHAKRGAPQVGYLRTQSEPIFNVPAVVTALIAVLVAVHGVREWLLSPEAENDLLWLFAFVPVRYERS